MNFNRCIGIASKNGTLEMAILDTGKPALEMNFPSTASGIEAIKVFLADYESAIRLAVSGVAALGLALALSNVSRQETFVVSIAVADQALALARYAEHAA